MWNIVLLKIAMKLLLLNVYISQLFATFCQTFPSLSAHLFWQFVIATLATHSFMRTRLLLLRSRHSTSFGYEPYYQAY